MKKRSLMAVFVLCLPLAALLITGCASRFGGADLLNAGSGGVNKTGESTEQVAGRGDTEIENKVIRWFLDSEPRGARVFWRIVSSHHDVNNTNESYLGMTPFEETRSLDVRGLSQANAGNVQIEFRLVRDGYYEQRKRFNVQSAFDQKEISAYFGLEKEE